MSVGSSLTEWPTKRKHWDYERPSSAGSESSSSSEDSILDFKKSYWSVLSKAGPYKPFGMEWKSFMHPSLLVAPKAIRKLPTVSWYIDKMMQ